MSVKVSTRYSINKADIVGWLKNALIFSAPVIIVAIPAVIGEIPSDWAYAGITIFLLNRVVDLIKRWYAGKPKA